MADWFEENAPPVEEPPPQEQDWFAQNAPPPDSSPQQYAQQVSTEPPPEEERAIAAQHPIIEAAAQGIGDVVAGIPQMVAQLPKLAYEGAQFAALPSERPRILGEVIPQAIEQGQQMASDIQAPLGTRESFRGLANVGLMALPALGEVGGLSRVLFGRGVPKAPPIQTTSLRETLFGRENPTATAATEAVVEPTVTARVGSEIPAQPIETDVATSQVQEPTASTTAKPLTQTTEGEPTNASEQSNAQVQAGTTAQRVETGTESAIPRPSDSNNVVGETQGTAARGQVPARQGTEAQPEIKRTDIPEDASVLIRGRKVNGGEGIVEMNARQAEGRLTKERSSYQTLLDCLGR